MKPIIGILVEIDDELTAKAQIAYSNAIEKSGGVPIVLPYVNNAETIENFVRLCDGFVFSGGADVHPKRYGEQIKPTCEKVQAYRDELEFKVFEQAIKTKKPILGICRGMQFINVALGGTLYQDIPTELPMQLPHRQEKEKYSLFHDVQILTNTPLFHLIGKPTVLANSLHHQAIKTLGAGLKIMAVTKDEMIEAVYLQEERYVRAYQWHPERLYEENEDNRRIFDDFIKACR